MAGITAPFPTDGQNPWGSDLRAWGEQVEGALNDTGWRQVIITDDSGGAYDYTLLVRRLGNIVSASISNLKNVTDYSTIMGGVSFPGAGFHADSAMTTYAMVQDWYGGDFPAGVHLFVTGDTLAVAGPILPAMELRGTISWVTDDDWPDPLPGTPYPS